MQRIAAEVGYSETAFAAPQGDGFRVRYFAPVGEVAFCGHATIALGSVLGAQFGAKTYMLHLNTATISVEALRADDGWGAKLISPPTSHTVIAEADLDAALALFRLGRPDLDPAIPPAIIKGGATHLLIVLRDRAALAAMRYNMQDGAALMRRMSVTTIMLVHRESETVIHARNAFAAFGVYEDPATGAAAAAFAGYLRDTGIQSLPFVIRQGDDMGSPSMIHVTPRPGQGAEVEIAGATRSLSVRPPRR